MTFVRIKLYYKSIRRKEIVLKNKNKGKVIINYIIIQIIFMYICFIRFIYDFIQLNTVLAIIKL